MVGGVLPEEAAIGADDGVGPAVHENQIIAATDIGLRTARCGQRPAPALLRHKA